jgi:hypothetical protein
MERVPFEQIVAKAMELFDKAVICEDEVLQKELFLNHSKYLESNGWNDKDFDAELIKRIDQNWNDKTIN